MANIFSRQICLKFFSPTPKPPPPRVINEEETGSEYTLVGVHVNSVGYTLGSLVVAGVFIICTYLCVKKCLSSCFSPCLACKSWTTCSGCCKTQEKDEAAGEDIYEEVLESWNILKLLQGVNGNSRFRDDCLQVRMRRRLYLVLR